VRKNREAKEQRKAQKLEQQQAKEAPNAN